ncbi:MAG: SMC-Scp complex subunit ScpB [Bdellovibrionales bacterium]|nr:SMC-Scp complex subunit ScpB [Bdellovibrionales bacterium]
MIKDESDVANEEKDQEADQIPNQSVDEEAHQEYASSDEPDLDEEFSAEGTELEGFESASVEDAEFIEEDRIISIVESLLFATDRPMSLSQIKMAFKGTLTNSKQIRRAIEQLTIEYAGAQRGVVIEEVNSGFQIRTKIDNMPYLRRLVKSRPFKLSGPALEVMAIAAYKQPVTKAEIDEVRGVESGHLLRGLMEKGLVNFAGKSELPGKPMLYATTKKFLEIFGLRNIRELPSLAEIDELIPEGIGDDEISNDESQLGLKDISGDLSRDAGITYSEGEEELLKISSELETISTSSLFFEEEKNRAKEKRDRERAQDIRDALTLGENVEAKDVKWLERFEKRIKEAQEALEQKAAEQASQDAAIQPISEKPHEVDIEVDQEIEAAFDTYFDTRPKENEEVSLNLKKGQALEQVQEQELEIVLDDFSNEDPVEDAWESKSFKKSDAEKEKSSSSTKDLDEPPPL